MKTSEEEETGGGAVTTTGGKVVSSGRCGASSGFGSWADTPCANDAPTSNAKPATRREQKNL